MVNDNKSKTIINNKNIIQICGNLKPKKKAKTNRQLSSPSNFPLDTRINPALYTSINSFPNSSSLDDQSRRVRFIQAMRDPQSTKSPYSLFDTGSNTFPRQGNTSGVEQQIQPQISQSDYFSNPRTLSRPIRRFEASSPFQLDDSTAMSPINRFHSPFQSDNQDDEEEEDDDEAVVEELKPIQRYEAPETRFNSPNKTHIPFKSPYKQPEPPHTLTLQDEAIITDNEAQQLADEKEREEARALENEYKAIREEEEKRRLEKLKSAQNKSRERLARELERKKVIQSKFKAVSDKLTEFIGTGAQKIKKDSTLKTEIKELLKDPTFTEFQGNRNLGALADARKILAFLNEGSATVLADIRRIEDDKVELEKHLTRQAPTGKGVIHKLAVGGGAGGGEKGSITNK